MAKKKKTTKKTRSKAPQLAVPNWIKKLDADKKKNPKPYLFKEIYAALDALHELTESADIEARPKVDLEFYATTLTHLSLTLKFRLDDLTGMKVRF